MKVAPIDVLLNKEVIPDKQFFFISGNELTLIEKIKSLIIDNCQQKEMALVTKIDSLKEFVDETPWVHMDIAGTAWVKTDKPTVPKFGTGFGVRTLNQLVKQAYDTQKD